MPDPNRTDLLMVSASIIFVLFMYQSSFFSVDMNSGNELADT